jgi:putative transport protein
LHLEPITVNIEIAGLLRSSDSMLIFTVLGFGLLLGRGRVFGIPLGSTAGILLVALLFGYWGFELSLASESLGFMLFIFCVGIEAGPNFFSTFLQDGIRYITLAAVVALSGIATTFAIARAASLEPGLAAGMLAGALTSTPTLAGAQGAANRLIGEIGMEGRDAIVTQIGVGYALTYVVGLLGLLVVVRLVPRIFSLDLPRSARAIAIERGLEGGRNQTRRTPILRAYNVSPDAAGKIGGKTLRELGIYEQFGLSVQRVKRHGEIFTPDSETVLQTGDRAAFVGYPSSHARAALDFQEEVFDTDLLEFQIVRKPVVVASTQVIGKELRELDLVTRYGCFVDSCERAQVPLSVEPGLRLNRGDILELCGEASRVAAAAEAIGFVAQDSHKSDLTTFAFFFAFGLLIAQLSLVLGELTVTLGSAGGLLASGILLGHYRARNPIMGHIPQGAINILKDLGLGIFMVGIGLNAGEDFVRIILERGPHVVAAGLIIVLLPVSLGFLAGYFLLRMNAALLLGAIAGAMTSTPALEAINDMAKSNIPALGYAGTYTFANVFLTLGGAAIITM